MSDEVDVPPPLVPRVTPVPRRQADIVADKRLAGRNLTLRQKARIRTHQDAASTS